MEVFKGARGVGSRFWEGESQVVGGRSVRGLLQSPPPPLPQEMSRVVGFCLYFEVTSLPQFRHL